MTATKDAATHLAELFTRFGDCPAAPGAKEVDIAEIKKVFTEFQLPLPTDLLEVYKITLGIFGVLHCDPVLYSPCIFDGPPFSQVDTLIWEQEDAEKKGVLWLGISSKSDLIIDLDGQCGTLPDFHEDGTVGIINPTDFETAFLAYVKDQEAELRNEYGEI